MSASVEIPNPVTGYIGGRWLSPSPSRHELPIISAASEKQISLLQESDADEVDAAVRNARETFDSGVWSQLPVDERKRVLWRIARRIRHRADELAYLESLHTSSPIAQCRSRHVPRAALNFEFFAEFISQVQDPAFDQDPATLTVVRRDPVGVAGLIAPWNAPLALATMKVAGAIAFGNSCVLKPSELTPLSFVPLMDIFQDAGLPDGVVNIVNGRGHVTGSALVEHPLTDIVCFTGGTETGRAIGASAGRGLKKVVTELGGKSANIIFEDADLDRAVDGALIGIFSNNGQQCLAGSRILLQDSIAQEFIDRFLARTAKIKIGDPLDPSTELGPLISKAHYERVLGYTEIAKSESKLLYGGKRACGFDSGYYMEPTVVLAESNRARVCQEEIFGPFASLLTFSDLDEAIDIANDSEFGLVAYAWSRDVKKIGAVMDRIKAGVLWINTPITRELKAPFGGYKSSGVGRAGGRWSRDLFTEEKTVTMPLKDTPLHKIGMG